MLAPGTAVRVKLDWPETRGHCHIRTPHYLRGREGVVERHLGRFRNPEDLAFARPAAELDLYHVRFDQPALWGEGQTGDALVVELFEPWLEPR
jgi:nitrile hydratase